MSIDYKSISDEILEKRNECIRKRKTTVRKITAFVLPLVIAVGTLFALDARSTMSIDPIYDNASISSGDINHKSTVEIADSEILNQISQFASANQENGSGNYVNAHLWQNGFNENADYLMKITNSNGIIVLVIITENYILTQSGKLLYIAESDYQELLGLIK